MGMTEKRMNIVVQENAAMGNVYENIFFCFFMETTIILDLANYRVVLPLVKIVPQTLLAAQKPV